MSKEHPFAIIKAVDNNGSCVAKSNLEYGLLVFVPPFLQQYISVVCTSERQHFYLANRGMVISKF